MVIKMTYADEKCSNCKFFSNNQLNSGQLAACRRYPPTMFQTPDKKPHEFYYIDLVPTVELEDWCGEWKPDTGTVWQEKDENYT